MPLQAEETHRPLPTFTVGAEDAAPEGWAALWGTPDADDAADADLWADDDAEADADDAADEADPWAEDAAEAAAAAAAAPKIRVSIRDRMDALHARARAQNPAPAFSGGQAGTLCPVCRRPGCRWWGNGR